MKKHLGRYLPAPARTALIHAYRAYTYTVAASMDAVESVRGKRPPMVPPRRKIFTGSGDFLQTGQEFLRYFKDLGHLKPNHRVLDVGSGIGRMAIPLTSYLSHEGSYEGFDIVPLGVEWCQKEITSRHPNFRFQLADIYNKEYNPTGRLAAKDYAFPFADNTFDFVFLTSVFTHMLPEDLEHYVAEICRVLRPGGRCLTTFFLLNEVSEELQTAGKSAIRFDFDLGVCKARRKDVLEDAIAYEEPYVRTLFTNRNLTIIEPIHYGSWSGREQFLSYQDIIISAKS